MFLFKCFFLTPSGADRPGDLRGRAPRDGRRHGLRQVPCPGLPPPRQDLLVEGGETHPELRLGGQSIETIS